LVTKKKFLSYIIVTDSVTKFQGTTKVIWDASNVYSTHCTYPTHPQTKERFVVSVTFARIKYLSTVRLLA